MLPFDIVRKTKKIMVRNCQWLSIMILEYAVNSIIYNNVLHGKFGRFWAIWDIESLSVISAGQRTG